MVKDILEFSSTGKPFFFFFFQFRDKRTTDKNDVPEHLFHVPNISHVMSQHTMSKSTNHQRKIEHIDYRGGTNKQIYGTQYYVRCFGIRIAYDSVA